jgi:pimeloyl-ACP methyl ester carboxylesterase
MPTTFIYGDIDWMDYTHAVNVAPIMNVPTKVAVVKNAGHHLYLDNPEGFNAAVIAELKDSKIAHPAVAYSFTN